MKNDQKLFKPFVFSNGIELKNRIVMAPMTTWAGNDDFTISDEEIAWYQKRVKGVGLVITGCTHVAPEGIGFTHEFAAFGDSFIPGLKRLAAVAKSEGAPAILQIFHAGNKAVPELSPNARVVSASAIKSEVTPFTPAELLIPEALMEAEIWTIIKAFGDTTRRAIEAGFDGVEVHGAHGFLNQNFLSPLFNKRTDNWGGSLENRLRFSTEVVREVRRVIATYADRPFILGFRISPEELPADGLRLKDSLALTDRLIQEQVDYLHYSLFQVLTQKPLDIDTNKTITQLLTDYVKNRVPVIAAGQVTTPEEAENALSSGLSMVAIGRGMVINPEWAQWAAAGEEKTKFKMVLDPEQAAEKEIPQKLMAIVDHAKGWIRTTVQATA